MRILKVAPPLVVLFGVFVLLGGYWGTEDFIHSALNAYARSTYPVNMMLMILLGASMLLVMINLFVYMIGLPDKTGTTARFFSVAILVIALVIGTMYVTIVTGLITGLFNTDADDPTQKIFQFGLVVSLIVFTTFLAVDIILSLSDRKIRLHEGEQGLSSEGQMSQKSILYIDLPVIFILLANVWLNGVVAKNDIYRQVFDNDFLHPILVAIPDSATFELFCNGLSAGVTIALLISSQWIFFALGIGSKPGDAVSVENDGAAQDQTSPPDPEPPPLNTPDTSSSE